VSRITSRRHPLVQRIRALASGRTPDDPVLLDGEHLVAEALRARVPVEAVMRVNGAFADLVDAARRAGADIHEVTADVLDAISPVRAPSGIVALARWAPAAIDATFANASGVVLGLVDLQDPGNAGTIVRSADALGAGAVAMLDRSANPAGWKCLRGAMGSTFRVPVARGSSSEAVATARRLGMRVMAAAAEGGESIETADFGRAALVLLGNEGAGLPESLVDQADIRITIPMRRGANSLNVAAAAAVVLWEARRR
jgi:TrmH family RNA methyltransferase